MAFGVTTYQDRTAGAYSGAVGLLQAENNSLNQNFETSSKMDTLGINSFRYDLFDAPAVVIDARTKSDILDPIKNNKNDIISLGGLSEAENNMVYYSSSSSALSALETLYGAPTDNDSVISTRQIITSLTWSGAANTMGIFISAGDLIKTTNADETDISTGVALFDVSSPIDSSARVDIQDINGNISVGQSFYINNVRNSDVVNTEFAASGEVFEDSVVVLYYPHLHPADPSVSSPLSNPQFKILPVNGEDGVGSGQTYYRNSIQGSYDSFPFLTGEDPFKNGYSLLGDVYTVSSNHSAIATKCANIDALRGSDLTTGIQSYVGAGSTIKELRQRFAINQWSLIKNRIQTQQKINANNSAISILKNSAFQS